MNRCQWVRFSTFGVASSESPELRVAMRLRVRSGIGILASQQLVDRRQASAVKADGDGDANQLIRCAA